MRSLPEIMLATAVAMATAAVAATSFAQDYPSKPVRIIAGSVGAASDIVSRQLGQRLAERWGQSVVVDNRGGANATIAADLVAKARPDGYTLLMGQLASNATAPYLYKKVPYDPVRDFENITLVAKAPLVLLAHPSLPAADLPQLVDYAKKHAGKISYSAGGSGTASNLTMVLFRVNAGLDLLYVPYKGNAAALTAILSREAQVAFLPVLIALPHVAAGRLKAYAITTRKRFAGASDIPTVDEAGMPGFESTAWFGMFAPAGTAKALVSRLNRELVEILRAPSVRQELLTQGAEAAPSTPEELTAFVRSETVKWREVIKIAGMEPQ